MVEIKTSVANTPDVRWSHFQDPIHVEDALGRKFPFPSEFQFTDLEAMIRHKFREGPGSKEVSLGDYEVMDSKNRSKILSAQSHVVPGSSLTMAILIPKPPIPDGIIFDKAKAANDILDECISDGVPLHKAICPMPRCRSSTTRQVPGGGRQW